MARKGKFFNNIANGKVFFMCKFEPCMMLHSVPNSITCHEHDPFPLVISSLVISSQDDFQNWIHSRKLHAKHTKLDPSVFPITHQFEWSSCIKLLPGYSGQAMAPCTSNSLARSNMLHVISLRNFCKINQMRSIIQYQIHKPNLRQLQRTYSILFTGPLNLVSKGAWMVIRVVSNLYVKI